MVQVTPNRAHRVLLCLTSGLRRTAPMRSSESAHAGPPHGASLRREPGSIVKAAAAASEEEAEAATVATTGGAHQNQIIFRRARLCRAPRNKNAVHSQGGRHFEGENKRPHNTHRRERCSSPPSPSAVAAAAAAAAGTGRKTPLATRLRRTHTHGARRSM